MPKHVPIYDFGICDILKLLFPEDYQKQDCSTQAENYLHSIV